MLVVVRTVHLRLELGWFLHPRGLNPQREKEKVVVANLSFRTKVGQKAKTRVNPNLQRKAKASESLLIRVKVDLFLKTRENLKAKEKNVLRVVTNPKVVVSLKVQEKIGECLGTTILKEKGSLNRANFITLSNQCSPCIPCSPSNPCSPGGVILDMDSRRQPAESFRERVETCVRKIGESLGRGEAILIHCAHGIHRSGSFVVLILALFITLHDIYEDISPHTEWPHALEKAWGFWSTQRGLRLRSSHHHDYEQESWTAMQGFFGNLSESDDYGMAILLSRGLQQSTGTLRGHEADHQ